MRYQKKIVIFILKVSLFIIFGFGCTSNPIIPGIDPNPPVNPDNSTVSYIEVTASSSTIKVNQSQQFVVKGYNSDDEWVVLDKTKIKFWKWSVQGCYDCFKDYVDLNPKSGSLTTTFSSTKAGTFFIGACYQENNDDGEIDITNYTKIIVIE